MMTIACMVCGKEFKTINKRHLAQHGLTREEYIQQYPDAKLVSDESRENKKRGAALRLASMTEEAKSEAGKKAAASRLANGFTSWNDGKGGYSLEWSEEAKQHRKEVGAWNKGIPMCEEQKEKLSEKRKELYASGALIHWNTGKQTSEETKRKIRESCTGYKFTPEQKERLLAGHARYRQSDMYIPGMLGKKSTEYTKSFLVKLEKLVENPT